jgi:hypothetical protein
MIKPTVITLCFWTDDEGMEKVDLQFNAAEIGDLESAMSLLAKVSLLTFPEVGGKPITQMTTPERGKPN